MVQGIASRSKRYVEVLARTDEEGYALLKEFGLPFKK